MKAIPWILLVLSTALLTWLYSRPKTVVKLPPPPAKVESVRVVDERESDSLRAWIRQVRAADKKKLQQMLAQLAKRDTFFRTDTERIWVDVPAGDLRSVFIMDSTCNYQKDSISRQLELEKLRECPDVPAKPMPWYTVCGICASIGFAASLAVAH